MNDELALLRGKDYIVNDKILIKQPTLNEIFEYGEQEYFTMISNLTAIPSDIKSILFDTGIDYEAISDFELFTLLCKQFTSAKTSILFNKGLDFTKMNMMTNPENGDMIFTYLNNNCNATNDRIVIDSYIYELIVNYLRKMHGFKKTIEKAGNEYTKKVLIEEDRQVRLTPKEYKSFLKPLIIPMINCADFPYNFETVWNLPISVFIESVQQIQKYKNVGYLLQGVYSGCVDGTKVNKDELRWI